MISYHIIKYINISQLVINIIIFVLTIYYFFIHRLQKRQYMPTEVFRTPWKGWGLRTKDEVKKKLIFFHILYKIKSKRRTLYKITFVNVYKQFT